jgi:hypothetical protein
MNKTKKRRQKMQRVNDLIDAYILRKRAKQEKRNYLGASIIGDDCLRRIQLQYMHPGKAEFTAQQLRTFDIGHALEPLIAEWLHTAGFDLRTHDSKGKQFGFSTANGLIAGHVDGIIFEGGDLYGYPRLWECKTMNNKNWNDVDKRGLLVCTTHKSRFTWLT